MLLHNTENIYGIVISVKIDFMHIPQNSHILVQLSSELHNIV